MRIFHRPAAAAVFLVLGGCAQVLGLDPWKDPPGGTGGATGGAGGTGGSTASATHSKGPGGPESCADLVKNGSETDVDCGGDACPPCALDQACDNDADCASHLCQSNQCVPETSPPPCQPNPAGDPTCHDCLKNGDESDVDCGGDTCLPCGAGQHCAIDADCTSLVCKTGTCSAAAPGIACRGASDCASKDCVAGSCWTGFCCQ